LRSSKFIGLVAQDALNAVPYCISTVPSYLNPGDKEKTELYWVHDSAITYVLVNAVKELSSRLDKAENRIKWLEKEISKK
jgi:hypothetical protein